VELSSHGIVEAGVDARRVLIVEDDLDFAATLVELLSIQGIEAGCVHTANVARKIFETSTVPVVLLDVRLGQDNGLELLVELQSRWPGTVCVVLTACGDAETAVQALKGGAYDYLRKPVESVELFATLDRCFERIRLAEEKRLTERELRSRNDELADINARQAQILESAKEVASCHDTDRMGSLLLEEFTRNMDASQAAMYKVDEDVLLLLHAYSWRAAPAKILAESSDECPFFRAVRERAPVCLSEVAQLADGARWWSSVDDCSLLVIPVLQDDGQVETLLTLLRPSSTPFTNQDRELGLVLASLGAKIGRTQRATSRLRESEEQFRTLVANLAGAVYRCKGDSRVEMEFISDAIEDISGYQPTDLYAGGKTTYAEMIYPEDRDQVRCGVDDSMRSGRPFVLEYRLFDSKGDVRWVYEKGRALCDEAGGLRWLDGAIFDVTEIKQVEEKQRQLERQMNQVQKQESLGVLAGGIAHDFNNLLMPIMGNAELLKKEVRPENPIHASIAEIFQAGRRAKDLVNQILSFSRQADTALQVVNVADVIREALGLMRSSLSARIEVVEDFEDDSLQVMADASQLHQVLMNLFTNAFHAMENDGGTLSIFLTTKLLDERDGVTFPLLKTGSSYVHISIRDTGCGMGEHIIGRIFEPFFTTKGEDKGTGIGLATVRTIVGDLHGDVSVRSEVGVGTEFLVLLPRHIESPEDPNSKESALVDGQGRRVLLVDDEPSVLLVAEPMLRSLGYEPDAFSTGEEALARFREQPTAYDLVVTDQTMPGMTGAQLVVELRRVNQSLPVVLASGYSFSIEKDRIDHGDALVFVQKPFTREELAAAIRQALTAG
jgi:PAS domain S-box-containing protein